ncbi:MAG TPA: polysaccharide biosynthesis tyrosine autokinase [Ottowia sp.]|uniref:GumC family protein n=1 Tax=Ottowia sp. TaxID=1898956 RepID=UPI002BF0B7CB|nr:polysaccharide biosynthesis tyrosine autokinase [Ottowia sp.]HMN20908.1 polysaccharide biosynthesis tyrosine autokinase [Ottowia sp.]
MPVPGRGPGPSYPLGMPAQYGLGQPWQMQGRGDEEDDDVIDLADLWRMVLKHKWLLLSMALVGLLAALLVSFVRTPLYQAATTLQVDKRAASVVKFGREIDPETDLDDRTGMGTQLELLKSRVLAERVVDELRLDRLLARSQPALADATPAPADAGAAGADEAAEPGGLGKWLARIEDSWNKLREPAVASAAQLSREEVLKIFQNTVRIEQVRNSRIIKVTVDNPDPQLATRIANTITRAFIALNLERRLESSTYAKSFLDEQLAQTKVRLEQSERRLNQYARDNHILTLDEKTNVVNQTFTEFSTALANAEQERIKFESEYQAIEKAPDTSRQVLESKTIQEYKTQRIKLDAEYQQNLKIYKEDFPRMAQLRAQIEDLDRKIKVEVNSILRSVANQLATAKRQESLIRQRVAQTRGEIVQGQDLRVNYNLLKREVDTNRELYDGLLQQVKEVAVAGGVETNNIQVVDKAEVPLFPYKPQIPLNAAIGLLAGLTLGLMLIFLMESLDDSIKSADEVEKTFMVPLLGVIPNVKEKSNLPSLALLAHQDPRSSLAESYRSTRTALQFSTPEGAPRRLVVTSTSKGEGKSTTALALAINFAQLGSKVVLVDADMRNPAIHKYLGGRNAYGLSNFLSGHASDQPLVQDTKIAGLSVMTAGPAAPNPVELLMGPRFGDLLDRMHDEGYEYIIIDGPPVLGLADAIVLGNQVGSVLYVAQAGHTRKSHIKDAFRRLRMAGVVPRGMVLTKTTAQNTAYYAYENYYGYGANPKSDKKLATTKVEPALRAG